MTTAYVPHTIVNGIISLFLDGKMITVDKSHINYSNVLDAVINEKWDIVAALASVKKFISEWANKNVEVIGDTLFYKGVNVKNGLTTRIIKMIQQKEDAKPLINFFNNVMENPDNVSSDSKDIKNQLFSFLETNMMPITPDGCFLACKAVRNDYKDIHSGTYDNSVGQKPQMARRDVDNNSNETCSRGLHCCSFQYLKESSFASSTSNRLMIVKVNPKDVVSVPTDYGFTKMRVCEYEVIDEVEWNLSPTKVYEKQVVWKPKKEVKEEVKEVKSPVVESVSTNVNFHNVRDSKGRFIKKGVVPVVKGPKRDANGRFAKA